MVGVHGSQLRSGPVLMSAEGGGTAGAVNTYKGKDVWQGHLRLDSLLSALLLSCTKRKSL